MAAAGWRGRASAASTAAGLGSVLGLGARPLRGHVGGLVAQAGPGSWRAAEAAPRPPRRVGLLPVQSRGWRPADAAAAGRRWCWCWRRRRWRRQQRAAGLAAAAGLAPVWDLIDRSMMIRLIDGASLRLFFFRRARPARFITFPSCPFPHFRSSLGAVSARAPSRIFPSTHPPKGSRARTRVTDQQGRRRVRGRSAPPLLSPSLAAPRPHPHHPPRAARPQPIPPPPSPPPFLLERFCQPKKMLRFCNYTHTIVNAKQ